jgi:hypothetical protein
MVEEVNKIDHWGLEVYMCRNPTLRECEDETHIPKMGTWESSGTSESSEFDYKR